jgi:hypothetical protein
MIPAPMPRTATVATNRTSNMASSRCGTYIDVNYN